MCDKCQKCFKKVESGLKMEQNLKTLKSSIVETRNKLPRMTSDFLVREKRLLRSPASGVPMKHPRRFKVTGSQTQIHQDSLFKGTYKQ